MLEIAPILRNFPPDCQPARIEPLGAAGGLSGAQFWRITAPRGTLMLRRWPIEHPAPDRLRFIHAVLAHAANRGLEYLPIPIPTRDGKTFLDCDGYLWQLEPWLPGAADYEHSPSIEKLSAAMAALAEFHRAVSDFPASDDVRSADEAGNAVQRHYARLQELTSGKIDELARAISDSVWPELAAVARQFITRLPHAIPRALAHIEPLVAARLPLQPCIRDVWHDHVLFMGNKVTGVIDFGATAIDTPATDIARLLGSLVGTPYAPFRESPLTLADQSDAWQQGLAAYSTIRPLARDEVLAVAALNATSPILAGCNWIRWIYIDRRQFENPHQILVRFQRIVVQLSE